MGICVDRRIEKRGKDRKEMEVLSGALTFDIRNTVMMEGWVRVTAMKLNTSYRWETGGEKSMYSARM